MGQFQCLDNHHNMSQFDGLELLDSFLLEQIQDLRTLNQSFISKSRQTIYPNHSIFKGILNTYNKKSHYGQLYSNGHAYFGYFQDDLPHGFGIIIKDSCEYHRGNFHKGKFDGYGKQKSSHHLFEGQYSGGLRKKGVLKTKQIQYQGEFKDNKFDGEGRILFANGDSYNGFFEKGAFSGQGILTFSNQNTYEGAFKLGKYHGMGKFTWADGKCHAGLYQSGKLITPQIKSPMRRILKIKEQQTDTRKINYQKVRPPIVRGNGILNFS